jgi:hypothetical protein
VTLSEPSPCYAHLDWVSTTRDSARRKQASGRWSAAHVYLPAGCEVVADLSPEDAIATRRAPGRLRQGYDVVRQSFSDGGTLAFPFSLHESDAVACGIFEHSGDNAARAARTRPGHG